MFGAYHRLAFEDQAFFTSDLCDGAGGREVAAQDLDVAGGLDGVVEGADEGLVLWEGGVGLDVLCECLSGNSGNISIK